MRGLSFDRSFIPLILGLALFNVGGVLSLAPYIGERESTTFIAISVYISITAVFFAALIADNPLERMRTIRSGYVMAGCIASCFAIVHLGLGEHSLALTFLEKATDERELPVTALKVHPLYDPLRSEPRFERLLRRIGLLP